MRVLVTGASGRIGRSFVASCIDGDLEVVRADLHDGDPSSPFPFVALDLRDAAACRAACADVDAVVHLAADPSPEADFTTSVLPVNIVGTHSMATAAVEAEVGRFVFASSGQVVAGHPPDRQVREDDPPHPRNDYGVGKAFGEALCAALATTSDTTFVAIRFGYWGPEPPDAPFLERTAWVSPRDADQLLGLAVTQPVRGFLVANGSSDNRVKRLSLEATRSALGYAPVDDAFRDWP